MTGAAAPAAPPDIERKSFAAYDVKADAEQGIVQAIVNVFNNVDNGGEVVEPGCFAESIAQKAPKGVWMHDWRTPVAKTLEARELLPGDPLLPDALKDLGGLYVEGQFNLETQRGREAFSDIKFGLVDEFSIGYKVTQDRWEQKSGGKPVRHLVKGRLFEWSPVLVGMNDRTAIIGVKAAGDSAEPEPLALSDQVFHVADDAAAKDDEAAAAVAVGSFVAFERGSRELRGRVVQVVEDGPLPDTSLAGSKDDPALRVQIFVPSAEDGGWQATNRFIGESASKVSALTVRDAPADQTPTVVPTPNPVAPPPSEPAQATAGAKADGDGGDGDGADGDGAASEPLSFEQVTERVSRAINRSAMSLGGGYVYVVATYADNVIVRRMDYEADDHRYYRVMYGIDANGAVSLGEVEEVRQTYAPVKADHAAIELMTTWVAEANAALDGAADDAELKAGRTISGATYNCLAKARAGIKQADTEIGRLIAMGDPKRRAKRGESGTEAKGDGDAARRLRALAFEIDLAAAGADILDAIAS